MNAGGIATTVGDDFHWEGTEPLPAWPDLTPTTFGYHADFNEDFTAASVYLSSAITGAGLNWEMTWDGIDEPSFKGYSDGGIEASLTLIGADGTDFTGTTLTNENFLEEVAGMRVDYFPSEANPDGNFVAALVGQGPLHDFVPAAVPEPASLALIAMGLVGMLFFIRS